MIGNDHSLDFITTFVVHSLVFLLLQHSRYLYRIHSPSSFAFTTISIVAMDTTANTTGNSSPPRFATVLAARGRDDDRPSGKYECCTCSSMDHIKYKQLALALQKGTQYMIPRLPQNVLIHSRSRMLICFRFGILVALPLPQDSYRRTTLR